MAVASESTAAVGITVKSGWARVVLLRDGHGEPVVVDSTRLELCDPATPHSRQPYHAGFGTARTEGAGLAALVSAVEQYATNAASALFTTLLARYRLVGAGLVVGSLIDPHTIANPHIRIHALEGQLFRQCIEAGARACDIPTTTWRERDLYSHAAGALRRSETAIRATLTAIGRPVTGGWRSEHKAAAVAAWLVLHSSSRSRADA